MAEQDRATILLEALPYIQNFSGKTIVIKYGGAAQEKAELRAQFAKDITLLQFVGMRPIVIHGGGPQINRLLADLGIQSEFVDGHRVTDDAAMDVVEMVLAGRINKEIVGLLQKEGAKAVGLSGKDARLATGHVHTIKKKNADGSVQEVSLGRVGFVEESGVDPSILRSLEKDGYIPVIAPIAQDKEGKGLNINADTMAGAIASALKAEKLILLTDTPGILENGKTVTGLRPKDVANLKENGTITGGMIPKVDCCVNAVEHGVKRAHIIDGRVPHALLLEILTDTGVGTLIEGDAE